MVLGSGGRPADDAQIGDFLQYSSQRGVDVSATWVAERRGRLLWAVLPVVSPGRTMLLLSPGALPAGGDAPAAGMLIDAACGHHAARGVQLAQALLDPADLPARDLHVAHGFRVMAELIYLQTTVRRPPPPPPLPPGTQWLTYSSATHHLFARTIVASYGESLDCPGLNGLRDIEDVIAGHKVSGEFDPSLWFLLAERPPTGVADGADGADGEDGEDGDAQVDPAGPADGPRPLGVLLVSRMPHGDAAELVYLGLPPSARGRGIGDLLMRQALSVAPAAGRPRLTLAVDSGNAPAMKLYYRHGMQQIGAKSAMMRELKQRSEARG